MGEIASVMFLLVLTLWVVLFHGDPDLHDALLMWALEQSQ